MNQSIFKSSWLLSLVKCMRVVCETLWEIWLQKCKIDKENNAMHMNPITIDTWKDWSVKNLKTKIFEVSIGRKESSINRKNFLENFDWSSINQASIELGGEFLPKNWSFSIGWG